MQMMIGAEAGKTARDRGSGNAAVKQKIQHCGVSGLAMILMIFAYVDADFLCRS